MVEALFSMLRRLSALTMLVAVCDMLLPDGDMRRFARFAGGLLTMWMLASSLLGFVAEV